MQRALVVRGVLCGAIAGLFMFVFARILSEPQIQKAIDYESGRDAAQALLDKAAGVPAEAVEPAIFTRTIQADIGMGVGMIAFGMAMGALFAVVYTICLGRVGKLAPRSLALLVAGGGFLGIYLVPFIKYPANPPAIGHAETIRQRTVLYLAMVVCSLLFLALAVWLGQWLKPRLGNWNSSLLAAATFIVAIGIAMALLPSFGELAGNQQFGRLATETPQPLVDHNGVIVYPGFPADVLYQFRLYSVAGQLLLWSAIGLLFAPMAQRVLAPPGRAETAEAFL